MEKKKGQDGTGRDFRKKGRQQEQEPSLVWECGCPCAKVPLGTPPLALPPACSLVVDSQASYSCSKPNVSP